MAKNQPAKEKDAGTATPAPASNATNPAMPEPVTSAVNTDTETPAADLIADMSPPNVEAIAATQAADTGETPEPPQNNTTQPVKRGRGRPKGTTASKVSKLRPGETKGNAANLQQSEKDRLAQEGVEKTRAQIEMTATAAAQMTILSAVIVGGEDFAPSNNPLAGGMRDDIFLQQSFAAYFATKNVVDIPPGVALAFALITYAAPRFQKPAVKTRLGYVWGKVRGFFGGILKRKNGNAAQSNLGNDEKRQEHVSEATQRGI